MRTIAHLAGPVLALVLTLAFAFALAAGLPREAEAETMVSSYYSWELAGSPTASGVPFDPTAYTAAHKTLPPGTGRVGVGVVEAYPLSVPFRGRMLIS